MTPLFSRSVAPGYAHLVRAHSALTAGDRLTALHSFAKATAALKGATGVADVQNRRRAKHTALVLLDAVWTDALRTGDLGGSQ